jgi:hypothetical protein
MKRKCPLFLLVIFWLVAGIPAVAAAQETTSPPAEEKVKELTLVEADVCEKMEGTTPVNSGIVFSSNLDKIYCFSSFDPVPGEMDIYQEWYRKDKLRAKIKLTLKPPRWSTFSSMRIRKSDAGPWRVDITDGAGRVLKTLRFSVTE